MQRRPRETAAEMIHLRRHYLPDHIWFADDIFGFRVDWVNEFADALEAGVCTANTLLSEGLIRAAALHLRGQTRMVGSPLRLMSHDQRNDNRGLIHA